MHDILYPNIKCTGPPPSPTYLSTSGLNTSWSFMFMPEVPVNFTLAVTSLNTFEITRVVVIEEHYVFNAGSSMCAFDTEDCKLLVRLQNANSKL